MALFIGSSHGLFTVPCASLSPSSSGGSSSSVEHSASSRVRRTDKSAISRGGRLRSNPVFQAQLRQWAIAAAEENGLGFGEGAAADAEDRGQWDVSSNCVNPFFRVSPLADLPADSSKVHILFLSEGNVCRSVYAEAIFSSLLRQHGLQDLVSCSSKATRDYNVGESADPRAVLVAEMQELELPKGKVAQVFDCAIDIVMADLVLVMDKFTASDALKEVTVYEIINKEGQYSSKVRRLGEFCQTRNLEDIEDPLYGNMGGAEEVDLVEQIYYQVRDSCEGLLEFIKEMKANLGDSESLKDGVAQGLGRMDALNWLAPPMLSKV